MPHPNYLLLHVEDPVRSEAFYRRLLDCAPVQSSPVFVLFALDSGLRLGLWRRSDVQPPPDGRAGRSELGFRLADTEAVERAFEAWQALGVLILQPPADLGFGRAFLACDPDGHRLRVYALKQD